ncbi:MAG: sigma-54 dependent transcriptional regulator [Ignavibacterium album]|uniref:sigma-54-dependent transcriptional regulator n=1 Tax=Ignavibacterium album TaxID=591197 RepID=UPI0026ECE4EA|nr:sigma-54 dependent transcriptional regulator [Ignavibacterium album]MCX8105854.1 sigma-54 dependent transcriptional regulator [Ignavibacterium album]
MEKKHRILVVDDEEIVRQSLLAWFKEDGYEVDTAENADAALRLFEKGKYALILLDIKMPGMSGMDLLVKLKEYDPDAIIILITAYASVSSAVKALKSGAYDYITKPIDPDELSHIVEKALYQKDLEHENVKLKESIDEITKPDNLIGESHQMKEIYSLINTVAQTDTTVLILGESGTGKELVAKAIHLNSKRKYFPLVTVNCGALPESLLESELFGHEKGAFTGAHYRRKGKFEMANGGTIFLDEIGTISNKVQVELLRVIETKQFTRVGGSETITRDFRVIAATNENLEELVKEGKLREDLYYRLNVFTIHIPPLRERIEDIPLLANYFLKKFTTSMNKKVTGISDEAMSFLMKYKWPGNVRELENAIERAVVVCRNDKIQLDDLPFRISSNSLYSEVEDKSLSEVEKRHIALVLQENNWNISKSAEDLKIDRVTLYNKIKKYGLRKPE